MFVQDEFRVTPQVTLSGSARVDDRSVYGTFLSPRLSALVRAGDEWRLRVSGGRGYSPRRRLRKKPKRPG
ncbi:MAG: hypothetical protein A3F70_17320 [Acidobacteria bacterium RIFCSPLOWO2_12_FULL_67_14]|nr:MAG: hypothetical protein A3F70_17320 [Acidobacteria bacterium RIFCSPLOWO2_12_FULL_67_14]